MDVSGKKPEAERSGKRRGALLRLFGRDRKGSVAIEFAALAIPFSLLVFAIIESCISYAGHQLLTNAADDVARQFRTGQIKPADLVKDKNLVNKKICAQLELIVAKECPGLEIDLKAHKTFADAAAVRVRFLPSGDLDTTQFKIEPGLALSKNQLRVFYRWPVMTDFLRKSMSNMPGGKILHMASVTWQNEPFED
jgi:Flp pilus assembly protein TadG